MTEGNIAKWSVKEGDSFSAGDVLLEIETDKASMDVEAQDDGIMAKIVQGDGSKGIKVGTRIGVIAEPGDDLSTLEIPPEETVASSPKKETPKPSPKSEPESHAEAPPAPKPSSPPSADATAKKPTGPPKKQTYPLFPSVEYLMHEHHVELSAIDKMTPTGPKNRLLKGDVLAYLGSISASYPTELATSIEKLTHLDLSNIHLATPAPAPKPEKSAESVPKAVVEEQAAVPIEVTVPISMKAVAEVQKRIQSTLGVFMPLSTFIARATDVANEDLPRSKMQQPTADQLFNQVLGLHKVSVPTSVRGNFLPQITALPSFAPKAPKLPARNIDIIDILSGKTGSSLSSLSVRPPSGLSNSVNVFSVKVPKGDEKRAQIFLGRVKSVLEEEPGRLVL
jgi:pyruvate/2-oxoglutarate dehydrogenase complex dihydrolipoamide acyltransferase (E2) component